jgi:carbamoylphosphate synthase large subunit
MSRRETLLLTGGGGAAALSALELLRSFRPAVKIVVADSDEYSSSRETADAFAVLPPTSAEHDYRDALLATIDDYGVTAAIPCHSSELLQYAILAADLDARGVHWPYVSVHTAKTASDKSAVYELLVQNGVTVPPFAPVTGTPPTHVDRGARRVIKRRTGSGGVGMHVLDEGAPLPSNVLGSPDLYLQQIHVTGDELSLDGVILSDGRVLGPTARLRRKIRSGIAVVCDAVECTAGMREVFHAVACAIGTTGPLNVQGFQDDPGALAVIDVNPRFPAGGMALSAALGLNLPAAVAADLLRGPHTVLEPKIQYRSLRSYKVLTDHVVEVRMDARK